MACTFLVLSLLAAGPIMLAVAGSRIQLEQGLDVWSVAKGTIGNVGEVTPFVVANVSGVGSLQGGDWSVDFELFGIVDVSRCVVVHGNSSSTLGSD